MLAPMSTTCSDFTLEIWSLDQEPICGEITPEKVKSDLWHATQVCQPEDGNLKCSIIKKKKSSTEEWH